jgi:hypothetical protein
MGTWVLIAYLVSATGGERLYFQEFNSEKACNAAKTTLMVMGVSPTRTACLPK